MPLCRQSPWLVDPTWHQGVSSRFNIDLQRPTITAITIRNFNQANEIKFIKLWKIMLPCILSFFHFCFLIIFSFNNFIKHKTTLRVKEGYWQSFCYTYKTSWTKAKNESPGVTSNSQHSTRFCSHSSKCIMCFDIMLMQFVRFVLRNLRICVYNNMKIHTLYQF